MNNPFEIIIERLSNIEVLLFNLKDTPKNRNNQLKDEDLLNIKEAADLLFLEVPTLCGLVSRSEIPCMKKGKRLYFSKYELLPWVRTERKMTSLDIQAEADEFLSFPKRKGGNRG